MNNFYSIMLISLLIGGCASKPNNFENSQSEDLVKFAYAAIVDANEKLLVAAVDGNREEVKQLLYRGAELESKDTDGNTALHIAVLNDHSDVVKLLLFEGADKNTQNNRGFTPVVSAVKTNNITIVQMLLADGADANIKNADGDNVYLLAKKGASRPLRDLIKNYNMVFGVYLDVRGKDVNEKLFFDAASMALRKRGWQIQRFDDSSVQGRLENGGLTYKCLIELNNDDILVRFVKGYGSDTFNHLRNLRNDIDRALRSNIISSSANY